MSASRVMTSGELRQVLKILRSHDVFPCRLRFLLIRWTLLCRHPLDQQNTSMLRSVPGLEGAARNIMGPIAEQVSTTMQIRYTYLPLSVLLGFEFHPGRRCNLSSILLELLAV